MSTEQMLKKKKRLSLTFQLGYVTYKYSTEFLSGALKNMVTTTSFTWVENP